MTEVLLALASVGVFYLFLAVRIVPQAQNYIIERLGRFHRKLEAGIHIIVPMVDIVRHKVDILERQLPMIKVPTITLDNVTIEIHLAILYRVTDAARTVYRVQNIDQVIQTTIIGMVRSVIGKTDLDGVQSNRRLLTDEITREVEPVSEEWGIHLSRVEIIDVRVDDDTRNAMQLQLNAERNRRAVVTQAEGAREATQLRADGELYAAQRQAEAKRVLADAEAYAVNAVARAIADGGFDAINFETKKIQADAIKTLATGPNAKIVVVPSDVFDGFRPLIEAATRGRA